MKYSRTYIKQSGIGVVGHIYEHIVADSIISELFSQGIFKLLDYEMDASTYDGIITIEISTYNFKILKTIEAMFANRTVNSTVISTAIKQIEAEYKRKSEFDNKALKSELMTLYETPWTDSKKFTVSEPIVTKDARELKSSVGGFVRSAKREFCDYEFVYKVEDCPFELKTIAVYLLQIIGLIQIDNFYKTLKDGYDSGDEWAEYQSLVGYAHTITIARDSKISSKRIEKQFEAVMKLIRTPDFIKKVQKYIERESWSREPYFSKVSMFAKSYQIIGSRYLRRHNTTKNIDALISKLTYEIN